jgi:hypothetical protein
MDGFYSKTRSLRTDSKEEHEASVEKRFDFVKLGSKVRKTRQGFLRVPAAFTRAGILKYRRADGTVVRELRHPDDVFEQEAMASLEALPIIVDHVVTEVSPDNHKQVQVGFTATEVKRDAHDHALGEAIIQEADAIRGVAEGKLVEFSPCYECVIDPTPGMYKGERYDQRQRRIRYDNLALGPSGWGRSGPTVSFRMDGGAFCGLEEEQPKEGIKMEEFEIRMDGVTYKLSTAPGAQGPFIASVQKLRQRADAADEEIARLKGEVDAQKLKSEDLKKRLDSATAPEAIEKAARERAEVIEKAKAIVPDIRTDGLTVSEIKRKVVETKELRLDGIPENHLEGYISGAFAGFDTPKKEEKKAGPAYPEIGAKPINRQDGNAELPPDVLARQRMVKAGRGEEVKS